MTQNNWVPLPPANVEQNTRIWGTQFATEMRKKFLEISTKFDALGVGGLDFTQQINDLETALTALEGAVTTINEAVGAVDSITAQQKYVLSLVSAVGDIQGSVAKSANEAWKDAQKAAMNDGLSMLKGFIDARKNTTSVINEQLVRISENSVLAQQITATNASLSSTNDNVAAANAGIAAANTSIAVTNANVLAVQQAYVAADAAQATQLNSVSTQVASNTSSVSALQSSVDGIKASYQVNVTSQGYATGWYRLDTVGPISTFGVFANNFYIAQPSSTGGDPILPFVIGMKNGTSAIGIKADMYLDGSILARHLSVATLSAISANFGDATVTGKLTGGPGGKMVLDFTAGVFEIYA